MEVKEPNQSRTKLGLLRALVKQGAQHSWRTDTGVLCCSQQRQRAMICQRAEVLQGLSRFGRFEFGPIASAELFEEVGIMAVPLPKRGRRSYRFAPLINVGCCLGKTSRPKPVHEDPGAIRLELVLINTAHFHVMTGHLRRPSSTSRAGFCGSADAHGRARMTPL
jgi:hypothetical protein